MTEKKRAVVIFPGRGSYAAPELGYLGRHHGEQCNFINSIDSMLEKRGATTTAALDGAEKFSPAVHLPGRNASNLIYACALADYLAIDRDRYEIVAMCGNSLGWYLTIAAAAALSLEDGARLVDTMGGMMQERGVGGQILYPVVDEDWRRDPAREAAVGKALAEANTSGRAFLSIRLGGYVVLAGDDDGVRALEKALLKVDDRFPARLPKHAAFHTPLLDHVSEAAFEELPLSLFTPPEIPMIDGRGAIWTPRGTEPEGLRRYTLGAQIVEPYDFSKSVEVAVKEFAPDALILTGPGGSLGAPVAQLLIRLKWLGLDSKAAFSKRQKADPFVISLGRDDQRALAV